MIYPKFIKEQDTIGVTAPSKGVIDPPKIKRLDYAIKNFQEIGLNVLETPSVRKGDACKSAPSMIQAKELESLYENEDVDAIICAGGGEFLVEMLSYVDFSIIKNNPKWLQGFSDPTGLLFTITTNLDIATIYGPNFTSYGMNPWHESLTNSMELLKGNMITAESFSKYESGYTTYINGDEPYVLDTKVKWENLNDEDIITMKGRLIGGCIDILDCLFGTRFDKTLEFIERYQNDGIIWYFDNCELSMEALIRTLWKFKSNNWFKHTNGIIFGRSATLASNLNISFKDALKHSLNDLNIPVIFNADISHLSPSIPLINGAIASIQCQNHKGKINLYLK